MNALSEPCSTESADAISDLNAPDGPQSGKSKSTPSAGLSLLTDFLPVGNSQTSEIAGLETSNGSTVLPLGRHARTSPSWALVLETAARGSRDQSPSFSSKPYVSSASFGPFGWSLKTLLGC